MLRVISSGREGEERLESTATAMEEWRVVVSPPYQIFFSSIHGI